MKLSSEQYNELKEKLAEEAIENMVKEASENENEDNTMEVLSSERIDQIIEERKEMIKQAGENNHSEDEELIKRAMAVYEYSLNKIAACEEMYQDGATGQQACIEVLAEVGMYDENGFNKEAAEESEETIYFANKIAESYDDSINKIAAAEECYAEAINEANAALEVLAAYGYEIEE